MLCTDAARLFDALLQRFACAEDANRSVVRGETALLGESLYWCSAHIDFSQRFAVFRFQSGRKSRDALTDFPFHFGRWCELGFELPRKCFERAISCSATTVLVDGRVSQDSIEPRHESLVAGPVLRPGDDFRKRVLQDVLRDAAIADSALQVSEERAVVVEQHIK